MFILSLSTLFVKDWTDKMFLWSHHLTGLDPCPILSESTKPGRFPMLTGIALLNEVNYLRKQEKSNREIALECGYDRPGRTPHFTRFYENLMAAKGYHECMQIRESERNNYSNMRQKEVCEAVFYGWEYNKNNDKVLVNRTKIATSSYFFYDELLVNLVRGDGTVYAILYLPSKKSKTAKCRINAILRRVFGYSLFQKKGEWYIARPFKEDIPYTNGVRIEYPQI